VHVRFPFRESQRAASPVSWRNELAASISWPQHLSKRTLSGLLSKCPDCWRRPAALSTQAPPPSSRETDVSCQLPASRQWTNTEYNEWVKRAIDVPIRR
jgi:hypothetical protein